MPLAVALGQRAPTDILALLHCTCGVGEEQREVTTDEWCKMMHECSAHARGVDSTSAEEDQRSSLAGSG